MPIKSLYMSYELSENEGKTRVRFTYGDIDEKSGSFVKQVLGKLLVMKPIVLK